MHELRIDIDGLGFILYSPSAVAHISEGADYFEEHFSRDTDVARHVMACQLTTFCTGTPGRFRLRFLDGPLDEYSLRSADHTVRLGLEVHDQIICVRDCYDLMQWSADCPAEQRLTIPNGWYRLTVYTNRPPSGIWGHNQQIDIHLEPVRERPELQWDGIPTLCD